MALKGTAKYTGDVHAKVRPEVKEKIGRVAARFGVDPSVVVRWALDAYLTSDSVTPDLPEEVKQEQPG